MVILSSAQQSPSPMESNQIAESTLRHNRSLRDAILEFTAEEVQKNNTKFQENIAVISAQTSGKGLTLDIRG